MESTLRSSSPTWIESTQATLGELLAAEAGAAVDRSGHDLRCVAQNPRSYTAWFLAGVVGKREHEEVTV
jgi:hypothetical protein